jgi:sulfhydrogenase subunit beta (sulfur reductase)
MGGDTEPPPATPVLPQDLPDETVLLPAGGLQSLLDALAGLGYTIIGPTVRDGAIMLGPLHSVADLPGGWTDEQDAAHYRLHPSGSPALFGFAASAQSWKSILFPPRELLWSGERTATGFAVAPPATPPRYALLGVRSCDLHALAIHDQVLLGRGAADAAYAGRRQDAFIVAVACGNPGGTCFCVSMGTGPAPTAGYDLALTELTDGPGGHRFVATAGSERGHEVLRQLPVTPAGRADLGAAAEVVRSSAARMGRELDTTGIRDLLYDNAEHPHWDDVASRCLSCTNCTLVCPTCFCTSTEDITDLTGGHTERHRVWDSCFTSEFSHLTGGSVRGSTKSRYRQWMTHKLAAWIDQFGTSGCVGCGRCITWCPAAIDITKEAAALREPGPAIPAAGQQGGEGEP